MSLSIDQSSAARFPHTFLSCGIDLTYIHHNTILFLRCISTTFLLTPRLSASGWHVMVALVVFLPLPFLY